MASEDLKALRAQLQAAPFSEDLLEARSAYEGMGLNFPVGDKVQIYARQLDDCSAEVIAPDQGADTGAVVLYLHGGGYSLGSCNTHRHVAAEICRQTGARVWLLDYRLAPEHPLPAALEDSVAAYRHLLRTAPPGRIALAGDSAGAGLLVATLASLPAAGLAMPAAAYCMSPWVDMRCNSESMTLKSSEDAVATPSLLRLMASRYLAGGNPHDPRASPVLADLSGLPPMLIQVGSAEVLLDDAVLLARTLGIAGVEATLEIWPEMVHVWQCFYPVLPEGHAALRKGCGFITSRLTEA